FTSLNRLKQGLSRCMHYPETKNVSPGLYEPVHAMLEPVHNSQDVFYENLGKRMHQCKL
ncbi:hypothetical protein A2U01_0032285, partial [Trifolium medium]|nr:hypothetical protein [Trifolium medium]